VHARVGERVAVVRREMRIGVQHRGRDLRDVDARDRVCQGRSHRDAGAVADDEDVVSVEAAHQRRVCEQQLGGMS
jgi:hypothetical protein